jgi:hypothetical protein
MVVGSPTTSLDRSKARWERRAGKYFSFHNHHGPDDRFLSKGEAKRSARSFRGRLPLVPAIN